MFIRLLLAFLLQVSVISIGYAQAADTIIIEHVNVITMTSEAVLPDQRVLIAAGKIVRIENGSAPTSGRHSRRIDGRGKFLIPGLSEMHFHFRSNDIRSELKLLVANGITTVRNMASTPDRQHIEFRNKTRSGELPQVNYFTTGPYLTSRDITSKEQAAKVVSMHKDTGYDFLKLADNLPLEIYLELLQQAEEQRLPFVGHSQRNKPVEYSLRMKAIEHVEEFLYLSDSVGGESFF
jgi:dihydroorotase-like cyclic amidohydrolase